MSYVYEWQHVAVHASSLAHEAFLCTSSVRPVTCISSIQLPVLTNSIHVKAVVGELGTLLLAPAAHWLSDT